VRLELDGVTAAYDQTIALRDVSLTVPDGRVVALLGPNGAGKTTLLNIASGLLRPRFGRVLFDDVDVTHHRPEQRAELGMCHVTEGRSVFPGLTVTDNLKMFARPGQRADAIDRAVAAFPRLGERRSQIAGTMSGGEQQMLAIARAYVQQSPVVMLDEVSMGLAPILVDEIFAALGQLAREGHGLLIVEQYVAKALAIADLVYVLVRGRIVFAGEPAELSKTDVFAQYLGSETAATVS
jgi:branched-chain amino acid transport system ATP-binding protein